MLAIFKRELKAYFTSPLGYVFLAIFYAFSGVFFWIFSLEMGTTDLSTAFLLMFIVLMVFVPLLTMRLLSEDKKQKTDQLTLTAPISLFSIVMGKFLAAYAIFAAGVAVMPVYGFVMSSFAKVSWLPIWGNTLGLLLLGGIFVSGGLFISALTENQMIAAIGSFFINLMVLLLDTLIGMVPSGIVKTILGSISVYSRYAEITNGIFSLSSVIFFLSVTFIFLFLTVRVLEKKRWA
ncbi:MAG: ABC transporter permease [Ruminiclostridium sp.]|nr:ABC transporter permease [Ruminiclostridium sp.]MBQ8932465.1 ABC transporter permease [Ruminiclostridium sp.]